MGNSCGRTLTWAAAEMKVRVGQIARATGSPSHLGVSKMAKRSKKHAFGKAITLQSYRKTFPVQARDRLPLAGLARRTNVRTSLMLGTALAAGLTVISPVVSAIISTPATAATYNYGPGNYPNGISFYNVTQDTTIITHGITNIGDNGNGNGIEITTNANGLTLGVITSSDTDIGNVYSVQNDGIHIDAFNRNTTVNINNGATMYVGDDGISVAASS